MANADPSGQVNAVLISVGIVLVIAGLVNWFVPEDQGPTVVHERTIASRRVERSRPSVTRETTSQQERGGKTSNVARTGRKTVVENPSDTVTSTESPVASRRSETMSIALIGFGVLSLFAGSAWPRLQSITGPGGIGVTLVSTLSGVSDLAAQHDERLKALEANVEKLNTTVELLAQDRRSPREG